MADLTWIDDFKIRGGWGQTGNQSGIGDYAYLQRYNIGRIEWFKVAAEGDTTDYANADRLSARPICVRLTLLGKRLLRPILVWT